jgi:CheY-like chemotaxis protein
MSSRKRVLVAEDHADSREAIVTTLLAAGHEVIATDNGAAAMDALRQMMRVQRAPHVVVSDVFMSGASGLMFVSALRAAGCSARVLFVTAWPTRQLEARAHALEARVLTKPLDPLELAAIVSGLGGATPQPGHISGVRASPQRVLIVHDLMVNVAPIRAVLEKSFVVRTTPDPTEAFEHIAAGVACVVCATGGSVRVEHFQALRVNGTACPPFVFVAGCEEDVAPCERRGDVVVRYGEHDRLCDAVRVIVGSVVRGVGTKASE